MACPAQSLTPAPSSRPWKPAPSAAQTGRARDATEGPPVTAPHLVPNAGPTERRPEGRPINTRAAQTGRARDATEGPPVTAPHLVPDGGPDGSVVPKGAQ